MSPEVAPLVHALTRSAYRAGSPLVEVLWGDEELQLIRFREAPADSFSDCSAWLPRAFVEHAEAGHAMLSVTANDPDLLAGLPAERVSAVQQAGARAFQPFSELIGRNRTNWLVIGGAAARWAAKVYPDDAPAAATSRLWDAIFKMCRLEGPDTASGWQRHLDSLAQRRTRRDVRPRYRGRGPT